MKTFRPILFLSLFAACCSCQQNTIWDPFGGMEMPGMMPGGMYSGSEDDSFLSGVNTTDQTGGSTAGAVSDGTVSTFTVALDRSEFVEAALPADASDDDQIANTSFTRTIRIQFKESGSATVSGDTDGSVSVVGNDVTVNHTSSEIVRYVLSGKTSDGFFKLYSSRKQAIVLAGVDITNPDGAAINNQSKKRTYVVLEDGTKNYLRDGTSYADATDAEDMKGCLFSEGQLVFSGKGSLDVDANAKAGIRSDDYVRFMPGVDVYVDATSGNGIRGNDAVVISGGVINVKVSGDADKGISSDGMVLVEGGRTTLLTTGGQVWDEDEKDYSACAGVKADSLFRMTGGELSCQSSGAGGKGISTDGQFLMEGGLLRVVTTGKKYTSGTSSVSPKGMKADGDMLFSGGRSLVRSAGHEAVESKGALTVTGGTLEAYSPADDAVNCRNNMIISGGYVYAFSTGNDALDANKNVGIVGGVVVALGKGSPENGIDAAEGYSIFMNGGTVVAMGGSTAQTASSSAQPSVASTGTRGSQVALFDGENALLSFAIPTSVGGNALMISHAGLKAGSSYTLKTGVSVSGGTSFYGLVTDGTVSGGTHSATLTAAAQVGTGMGGGMMGPGGRW